MPRYKSDNDATTEILLDGIITLLNVLLERMKPLGPPATTEAFEEAIKAAGQHIIKRRRVEDDVAERALDQLNTALNQVLIESARYLR